MEDKMERRNETRTISEFQHENTVWHMGRANHRMLIALITVCVTFIITILVFVHGYTVREKNWLDTLSRLNYPITETGISDG